MGKYLEACCWCDGRGYVESDKFRQYKDSLRGIIKVDENDIRLLNSNLDPKIVICPSCQGTKCQTTAEGQELFQFLNWLELRGQIQ